MGTDISSSADILDVRDIIERVEELRGERDTLADEASAEGSQRVQASADHIEWVDTHGPELAALEDLLADLRGKGEDHAWQGHWYPVTLIRDSYFAKAMQELYEDIGGIPKGFPSYMVIDWEATAENLKVDYSAVKFDGVTYLYHCSSHRAPPTGDAAVST